MTFAEVMSSWSWLVSAILTIAGWFAIYRFQVSSQQKAFLLQMRKEAWKELHGAILEYQTGIFKDANRVQQLFYALLACTGKTQLQDRAIEDARQWVSSSPQTSGATVLFLLENFETLFPETSSMRLQIANIDTILQEGYSQARSELSRQFVDSTASNSTCLTPLTGAVNLHDLALDQIALLQDLLTFLQNNVFSSITKYTVPARVPVGENRVRLVLKKEDNRLHIVDGYGTVHDAPLTKTTPRSVPVDWR